MRINAALINSAKGIPDGTLMVMVWLPGRTRRTSMRVMFDGEPLTVIVRRRRLGRKYTRAAAKSRRGNP